MDKTNKLIELIEECLFLMDEEMEHGDYHSPDNYVPFEYEDEGDEYWHNHDEIVRKVVGKRMELEKLIKEIRGEVK